MMLVAIKAVFLAAAAVAIYLAVSAVAQLASRGPVCELPVVVEVLNGCGRAGIADKAASHLRACGFDVMYIGPRTDPGGLSDEQRLFRGRDGGPGQRRLSFILAGR
jgi:hypothetical protein